MKDVIVQSMMKVIAAYYYAGLVISQAFFGSLIQKSC
jgi:hypothetical protein